MPTAADWLASADNFFALGNFRAMRSCAREILALDARDPDGLALLAQASVYLGDHDTAARLLARNGPARNDRLTLAQAELAAAQLRLLDVVDLLAPALDVLAPLTVVRERAARLLVDVLALLARPEDAATLCQRLARAFPGDDQRHDEFNSAAHWFANYRPGAATVHTPAPRRTVGRAHSPLAVALVSPDLREHAVANFVAPLLRALTRDDFDLRVYFTGAADRVTARLRQLVPPEHWHGVDAATFTPLPCDLLLDLAGHSQGNVLARLATRLAPVQISMLGDVRSTDAPAVDVLLTDPAATPDLAAAQPHFSERLVLVPQLLCYDPAPVHALPPVRHADADTGRIVFGSFSNFNKVTDAALRLWQRLLDAVPGSRLAIKCKTASFADGRAEILRRCQRAGLDPARLDLLPYSADYLAAYNAVDLALDTFPYTGGATTCDALVMGVPVLALTRGDCPALQLSASVLTAAGLPELLARSADDYLARAVALARDAARLNAYHRGLRARLRRSPLMDQSRYADALAAALRQLARNR